MVRLLKAKNLLGKGKLSRDINNSDILGTKGGKNNAYDAVASVSVSVMLRQLRPSDTSILDQCMLRYVHTCIHTFLSTS